ncbi:hypothetical protein [Blastococcus sp. SYSU D00813]
MSTPQPAAPRTRPHPAFSALVGLTSLGVLLQGLWAGLFLRRDGDRETWVSVHQHAAEATIVLALLAVVAALVWLRHNRPAVVGSVALLVLLGVEYLLGLAGNESVAVVLHVPLAMVLMALAVYLPVVARRG